MARRQKILTTPDWRAAIKASPPKVCSDAPPLRKFSFDVRRKAVGTNPDTGMKIYRFTASTDVIDRDGDVMMQNGWELGNFGKNPVILYGHDQFGTFPVGKAVAATASGGSLSVDVDFTPRDVSENGHEVYRLVDAGFLNAVSVGFSPIEFVWNEEHNGYDFHRTELLEVSIVAVPANQEALIAAGLDTGCVKFMFSTDEGTTDPQGVATRKATDPRDGNEPSPDDVSLDPADAGTKTTQENDMDPKEFTELLAKALAPVVDLLKTLPEKIAGVIDTKAAEAADPEVSDADVARAITTAISAAATADDGALRDEE